VVIVASTINEDIKQMTQNAIYGALRSGLRTEVIIVETSEQTPQYDSATVVYYLHEEFNYNKALNQGAKLARGPFIVFANNDLKFSVGWGGHLVSKMFEGAHIVSPFCPHVKEYGERLTKEGYQVRRHFAGWCFMMSRMAYDTIGGLSEDYTYWCSDNIVMEQIKNKGLKHWLVKESVVEHIGNQTGQHMEEEERLERTLDQAKKFEQKTGQILFPKEVYENR